MKVVYSQRIKARCKLSTEGPLTSDRRTDRSLIDTKAVKNVTELIVQSCLNLAEIEIEFRKSHWNWCRNCCQVPLNFVPNFFRATLLAKLVEGGFCELKLFYGFIYFCFFSVWGGGGGGGVVQLSLYSVCFDLRMFSWNVLVAYPSKCQVRQSGVNPAEPMNQSVNLVIK